MPTASTHHMKTQHTTTGAGETAAQQPGHWVRVVVTKEVEVYIRGKQPDTRMEVLDLFNKHGNFQRITAWSAEKL
jgi:hypothetical protein